MWQIPQKIDGWCDLLRGGDGSNVETHQGAILIFVSVTAAQRMWNTMFILVTLKLELEIRGCVSVERKSSEVRGLTSEQGGYLLLGHHHRQRSLFLLSMCCHRGSDGRLWSFLDDCTADCKWASSRRDRERCEVGGNRLAAKEGRRFRLAGERRPQLSLIGGAAQPPGSSECLSCEHDHFK